MQPYRYAEVLAACALGLLSGLYGQGCTMLAQRSAVDAMAGIMERGMPAYRRETDLELAEPALAASLKLLEALLHSHPHHASLLEQTAQGFAAYTYAFVDPYLSAPGDEGRHRAAPQAQRARQLYRRGAHYGLRRLSHYHAAWQQALSLPVETLLPLVGVLDTEAVPALFWTIFCWGNALNLERQELATTLALPRLQVLITRLLELDETYLYGAPHLLQAVQYASRTPVLGGNPQRARWHFDRARDLSQGRLLIVPLLQAQFYAVQVQDREHFRQLLQSILDAPELLFPEQGFLNAVARRRAALLLAYIDDLFV